MKKLIYNIWNGPVTSIVGVALWGFCFYWIHNGTITFYYEGIGMIAAGILCVLLNDKQLVGIVRRVFNTQIKKPD